MAFLFADRPALLKDLDNDEARVIEYERVRDRWFAFTVPFSIAHGCVVTLITYASTVQGTELANCGLAAFYACYTLSALTLATVFVDREGPRRAMLIGFGAYCILAFSYALFSLTNNAVTFAIVIIASAGGGIGGGLIWVSQSRHYAAMCKDAAGPAPNNFASSFAFWYIGTEGVVNCVEINQCVGCTRR
jgi:MFS family permease